jgi:hypothetical protein
MKFHHAAALVSVGCYLMMPPGDVIRSCPDGSAPISEWEISDSFDTAAQCTIAKNKQWNEMFHLQLKRGFTKGRCGGWDALPLKVMNSQCIATDDPRLTKH